MSRLRPEPLPVLLSWQGVSILGDPSSVPSTAAAMANVEALALAFERFLESTGAKVITVVLSSALVDHLVLPGFQHWLSDANLFALARSRLSAHYGTEQSQREIVVAREAYGVSSAAMSAAKELLTQLCQIAKARKVKIAGIRPLAAVAIAALDHELNGHQGKVIWLEEADTFWIGVMENGHWLSMRSIPANSLQCSSRQDLLQRECLAAGLAEAEVVHFASIDSSHDPEKLGDFTQQVSNFSERLIASGNASRAPLDFLAKHSISPLSWRLLAVALVLLAITGAAWNNIQNRYSIASNALEHQLQTEQQARAKVRSTWNAQQSEFEIARAAYKIQTLPWPDLLAAVNESAGESVGLTVFKADSSTGSLVFEGEAKRFDDVQDFVDRLSKDPRVRGVTVTAITPGGDAAAGRIRFSLSANWASGIALDTGIQQ